LSQYFRDHENTIIHGDCLEVLKNFVSNGVDLILTDPPYGISDEGGGRMTFTNGKPDWMHNKMQESFFDQQSDEDMIEMFETLALIFNRVLREDGSIVIFYDRGKPHLLAPIFNKFRIRNTVAFVKKNPPPQMHMNNYRSGFEICGWFSRGKYKINFTAQDSMINVFYGLVGKHHTEHPTEKYSWMIEPLIRRHSSPGDLILDPFVGSGRICVEAKKLGRRYIGIDIKEKWCKVAREWLAETPEPAWKYFV